MHSKCLLISWYTVYFISPYREFKTNVGWNPVANGENISNTHTHLPPHTQHFKNVFGDILGPSLSTTSDNLTTDHLRCRRLYQDQQVENQYLSSSTCAPQPKLNMFCVLALAYLKLSPLFWKLYVSTPG